MQNYKRFVSDMFFTLFWVILSYLDVFCEYFRSICKNMCKFSPDKHYYFKNHSHFCKSYKIKNVVDRTFYTTGDVESCCNFERFHVTYLWWSYFLRIINIGADAAEKYLENMLILQTAFNKNFLSKVPEWTPISNKLQPSINQFSAANISNKDCYCKRCSF